MPASVKCPSLPHLSPPLSSAARHQRPRLRAAACPPAQGCRWAAAAALATGLQAGEAAGCCGLPSRSLPPRAAPATGFRRAPLAARRKCWPQPRAAAELTLQRRAMLARALPVLTATALRHLHRAHAPCHCDVRSPCRGSTRPRYAPCSRFSRRRIPPAARGAIVLLTPALKGALKVRAVLASSRKRLPYAAGGASLSSPPCIFNLSPER